jgi:hypothetical protein
MRDKKAVRSSKNPSGFFDVKQRLDLKNGHHGIPAADLPENDL